MARPIIPLDQKLNKRLDDIVVNPETACWIWTHLLDKDGYGLIQHVEKGKQFHFRAHRLSYEKFKGPIPNGKILDHLCRTRRCVNPNHLEPVTIGENVRRGGESLKTHCPRGHPYSGENLYQSKWGRQCKACKKIRWKTKS